MFDSDYKKINDVEFTDILNHARIFILNYKYRVLLLYKVLEKSQRSFLDSCPCHLCSTNLPCSSCKIITPIDIFTVSYGQTYLYKM